MPPLASVRRAPKKTVAGSIPVAANRIEESTVKTIKNKTNKPIRVPLPRGKVVHLGPAKSGQITTEAAEHPGLKKMIEAGDIELMDDVTAASEGGGSASRGHGAEGHGGGGVHRRSGDR